MKASEKPQELTDILSHNASQNPVRSDNDCKESYGIDDYQDLSDFRVIN